MYSSTDNMYEMWEETCVDLWDDGLEETQGLMRRESELESPTCFFEGVAVAFPICLFLWFLIYLGIRQVFY